jgi:hypothetical protein
MVKMNWFALISGVLMFATVISSKFSPWWRVQIGSDLITVNVDPFFTSFNVLGTISVIPLISALNIGAAALFIASGIALTVYAIKPAEKYSKHLLSFGWRRPLEVVFTFIAALASSLYVAPTVINMMAHSTVASTPIVPLIGSSIIQLSLSSFLNVSTKVTIPATATFTQSFFLGAAAAVLSILARIYHHIILGAKKKVEA